MGLGAKRRQPVLAGGLSPCVAVSLDGSEVMLVVVLELFGARGKGKEG